MPCLGRFFDVEVNETNKIPHLPIWSGIRRGHFDRRLLLQQDADSVRRVRDGQPHDRLARDGPLRRSQGGHPSHLVTSLEGRPTRARIVAFRDHRFGCCLSHRSSPPGVAFLLAAPDEILRRSKRFWCKETLSVCAYRQDTIVSTFVGGRGACFARKDKKYVGGRGDQPGD